PLLSQVSWVILGDSLSEVQIEDVVMEVVRREYAIQVGQRNQSDLVRDVPIRTPGYRRDLVSLDVAVGFVARELNACVVLGVDDAGVLHLDIGRGLEIYVPATQHPFQECL